MFKNCAWKLVVDAEHAKRWRCDEGPKRWEKFLGFI